MRIKKYDYDTCVKLKNPMRDFNEMKKFYDECFIKTDETYTNNNFKYILKTNEKIKAINYGYYQTNDCNGLMFLYEDECLYRVINKEEPRFFDLWIEEETKEALKELKKEFLKYKLNEKLNAELPINNTKKEKRIKI
jgi:hypothetical protein